MQTDSTMTGKSRRRAAAASLLTLTKTGRKSKAQPRPQISYSPRDERIGAVTEPNLNDVLCGRGGRINSHPGNVGFRELINFHRAAYLSDATKKLEKAHIASKIVREVRELEPPGRFLKQDATSGFWYDIGDAKAMKKAGQAMREDAQEFKKQTESVTGDTEQPKASPVPKRETVRVELNCDAYRSTTPPPKRDPEFDQIMPPEKRHSPTSSPGYTKPFVLDLHHDMAPPSIRRNNGRPSMTPSADFEYPVAGNHPGYYSRTANDYMAQPPLTGSSTTKRSTDNVFGRMFHPPSKANGSHLSGMSDISGVAPENSVISGISSLTAGDVPPRWEPQVNNNNHHHPISSPPVVTSLPPSSSYRQQIEPTGKPPSSTCDMSVGDMSLSVANMSLDMETATAVSWSKLT